MSGTDDVIRVLHVDDEPSLNDMIATFLERENGRITVHTATNPDEGQQILSTHDIDCIVSDYEMPGRNGIEFLEAVREEYPELPFILYTGKGSEEVASDAISSGVTDYLQKESGTDQYTILANRITNAVAQTRAVQEVSRTRAYFSTILSQSSDYVMIVDGHGQVDYISPAVERVLGYTPEDLEGTDAFEHIHPEDLSAASDAFADVLEHPDQDQTIEYRVRHADGSWRWVAVRGRNRLDDPVIEGVIVSVRDVTERKELEQKRQKIIDRMNDAVIEVGPEWQITLINERTENFVGLDESDLLGRDFWDVFRDAQGTHFEDEYRRAMETQEPVSMVDYYAGLEEWFDIDVYPNTDGGLAFYFRRVTKYKERERRLEQYKQIVNTMDDGAFVVDDEWNVEFVNEWISGYVDAPRDALEGQSIMRLADEYLAEEDDPARIEQALERAFARESVSESPERLELLIDTAGEQESFEYQFSPLTTDGETKSLVVTTRDITERKRHANQLRALNDRSQMLMTADTSDEIAEIGVEAAREVLELDANAIHLYDPDQSSLVPAAATDTVSDLIGKPPVFTAGDSIAWRAYEQGEAIAFDDIQDDPDIYNPETPIRSELHFPLADHGILLAGSPTPDAFDRQDFVLGKILAANISSALDQVTQTERLRARDAELTRQNERLTEFTRIVSHDLRNPLNVAEGGLELAREECDNEHLQHVGRALERMDALLEDLLTLAREGDTVTNFERVDLAGIAEVCWANVKTVDATLASQIDRAIYADESRLKQLFENLVRNAVEHGSDDVTVTVGELEDGFYVEDDGPGIPESEREKVFDAGYSTDEDGTGFGLSIVEKVVDAHNWEIYVTEGSDSGARFVITGVEFASE